ncbi:NAD(P)H-binding protein [Streptomyces noursei]|uniref:NAD(P)H-binding protein n=1 Tax=Streptomyces noursei TaxID=1971 RepID=UPI002155E15C|nr:NAD(P)H-binding protein [Streptomyces noursei]
MRATDRSRSALHQPPGRRLPPPGGSQPWSRPRVRAADFDDRESLTRAFDGAERALVISTDALGRRVQQHGNAFDAAVRAGVGQLLYTSLARAGESGNPLVPAPEHRATERLLARSGVPFTVLRNNIYPDVLLELASLREAVKTGVLGSISGTSGEGDIGYLGCIGYVGYVAREDCAAVRAALLAEGGHTGEYLDVTGPVAVNYAGIADALTQATGRPVRFEARPEPESAAAYAARGAEPERIAMAAQLWAAAREGWLDIATHAVERLTGRPATTLAEFFARHREALLGQVESDDDVDRSGSA